MVSGRRCALLFVSFSGIALCLATAPRPLASDDTPDTGTTIPVQVEGTETSFDLTATSSSDQFLLVISSLSHGAGAYPVEVTTEAVADPKPIRTISNHLPASWSKRVDDCRKQLLMSRQLIRIVSGQSPSAATPAERVFWLMTRGTDFSDAKNYTAVHARLETAGQHCAVYVDSSCPPSDRLADLVRQTRDTFDQDVYPKAQRLLGQHRDIDQDGRFAILLTPWLARLADGTVSLGGFVRGSDFYGDVDPPFGNRCDMMYLNAELPPGPHLLTLIAHEYTHAVTLCEHVFTRYLPGRTGQEEESWLDESIAHLAENLHNYSWSNLDYRISAFLSEPEKYRLVVDDYYAAGIWRGHGNRGSTYLFLRWCVDQYGEEILRDLIQTNLSGTESVEVVLGRPFEELYRDWSLSMFLSHTGLDNRVQERLRFFSMRGELNGRLLAGPRTTWLDLSGDSLRFNLAGTSSKYLIGHSSASTGVRVRVRGDAAARLQVSLRRLPRDLPRLQVDATTLESSAEPGTTHVALRVTECNGIPVRLERMAWERSTRGTNRDASQGFCSPILNEPEIEQLFGSTLLPAFSSRTSVQLPFRLAATHDDPIVIKIIGRDPAGRSIAGWCSLPGGPPRDQQTASAADTISR